MPVQMVCDSTSLVSAALRDSLTPSGNSSSAGGGLGGGNAMSVASSSFYGAASSSSGNGPLFPDSEEDYNRIENQLSNALKRDQLKPIRYEEVPSYGNELDNLKSKYTVLKTTASSSSSNGINGSNSIGGAGTINGSTNTNNHSSAPLLMNGGKGMAKLSAANATCNGNSQQSKYLFRWWVGDESNVLWETSAEPWGRTSTYFPSPYQVAGCYSSYVV